MTKEEPDDFCVICGDAIPVSEDNSYCESCYEEEMVESKINELSSLRSLWSMAR